ncbi:MAG TPA: cadherin repeat domain-containing protein [Cellvibrionaceae bacterium]
MFKQLIAYALLTGFSINSVAAANRADYDIDNDGLIEINDLEDLNEIRHNLDGKTLYGRSAGCPNTGCVGFELQAVLDFDTNGDGIFNAQDTYWNNGEGWLPLAKGNTEKFSALFDGNGMTIRNLVINRPNAEIQSLFGVTEHASIRNLGISGHLTKIVGAGYVASLVSKAYNTAFNGVFATGEITANTLQTPVGGLIAYADAKSSLYNSFTSIRLSGNHAQIGGLVGLSDGIQINASYAIGAIFDNYFSNQPALAPRTIGGLVGHSNSATPVINSYWAVDTTGQTTAGDQVLGAAGATLAQLKCATEANNSNCIADVVLYKDWNIPTSNTGGVAWRFAAGFLPFLTINNSSYADSDADTILDNEDCFPHNDAASIDSDNDGTPDTWNSNCDTNCQNASSLLLDAYPNDYLLALDRNNNGLLDAWSAFCNLICQETYAKQGIEVEIQDADKDGILDDIDTDDNNDQILDADANSNGLIDIHTLEEFDAIRYDLAGQSRRLSATGTSDSSGCPLKYESNAGLITQCHGYELLNDLDFDKNKNGQFDSDDAYWNEGKGWQPISGGFSAAFEGNGFAIRHLTILNEQISGGLFLEITSPVIRNVAIIDFNLHIKRGGPLASSIFGAQVNAIFTQGVVTCNEKDFGNLGGLVENIYDSASIRNALIATDIKCARNGYFGGLASLGYGLDNPSNNTAVLVVGQLNVFKANFGSPGAISALQADVSNTYWAIDTTRQEHAGNEVTGATGATLAQLQCPESANNTTCLTGITLYKDWDKEKDAAGNTYWLFSNNHQLPSLKLSGKQYSYTPKPLLPNQPPVVRLQLEQNGKVVTAANSISVITLRAVITDPNGEDAHNLNWDFGQVYGTQKLNTFTFDRQKPGIYTVAVTVKDSGYPSLSSSAQLTFEYKEELNLAVDKPAEPTEEKQAGSINPWLLLGLIGLMRLRIRSRRMN